jgi:hypothetical protein
MKFSNPSLPNPTKATKAMEGYERKNKEEIHKELQDLDPIRSPHIEDKVIGGNVDPDLLLMTHKYRRSQQSSREVKPKFIDSTQGGAKEYL